MAKAGDEEAGEVAVAREAIRCTVASWRGVGLCAGPLPGSIEFRFRHKVLGHLHAVWGDAAMADLVFPPATGDELIATGRVQPHPIVPGLGWATVPIRRQADVEAVVALFREAYEAACHHLRLV